MCIRVCRLILAHERIAHCLTIFWFVAPKYFRFHDEAVDGAVVLFCYRVQRVTRTWVGNNKYNLVEVSEPGLCHSHICGPTDGKHNFYNPTLD